MGRVDNGRGLDIGGGLDYAHIERGIHFSARGRYLLVHEQAGYEEWGANMILRISPRTGEQGPVLNFSPGWGTPTYGDDAMSDRVRGMGLAGIASAQPASAARPDRFELDVGYRFFTYAGDGFVTPFAGWSTRGRGHQSYRLGSRIDVGRGLNVNVEGARQTRDQGTSNYAIRVAGRLFW